MSPAIASLLSMLDEPDHTIQGHALRALLPIVDTCWPEISERVVKIEELAETDSFPHRLLAAALASKCFFHLEGAPPSPPPSPPTDARALACLPACVLAARVRRRDSPGAGEPRALAAEPRRVLDDHRGPVLGHFCRAARPRAAAQ
jgi:hypothetical protein